MSELPSFTKIVAGLSDSIPFVGPEAIERRVGKTFELRLGANESAFGVSPQAVTAMQSAIRRLHWYNDPENHDLAGCPRRASPHFGSRSCYWGGNR